MYMYGVSPSSVEVKVDAFKLFIQRENAKAHILFLRTIIIGVNNKCTCIDANKCTVKFRSTHL